MKITKQTTIKKLLLSILLVIMLGNFVMPNYVQASSPGEKLISALVYSISYIGDAALSLMQRMIVGTPDIKILENYVIKYSPAIIFSNTLPVLDINFLSPMRDEQILVSGGENLQININNVDESIVNNVFSRLHTESDSGKYSDIVNILQGTITALSPNDYNFRMDIKKDELPNTTPNDLKLDNLLEVTLVCTADNKLIAVPKVDAILDGYEYSQDTICWTELSTSEIEAFRKGSTEANFVTIKSVAGVLQSTISGWYKALRTIAIVGLLSVLVYIGIRIILSSSSSQDKAKYKNMLKDWIVALCIVFILHYIMMFMLEIKDNLIEIMNVNVIETSINEGEGNSDKMMSKIRNDLVAYSEEGDTWDTIGYGVMYLALVIITGVFTIQYLKRVVYMAFLTMIAPMIALTYPLDKIKDGKAQAFSYWLKEYIFNCLIQPVHLLLYTVLISSSMSFAEENILYAIVALAFIVPAEKVIKEMFGMKSQTSVGTLGAAAGGAMVMSMLSKLKGKPPKEEGEQAPKVRTADQNGGTAQTGSSGGSAGGTAQRGAGGNVRTSGAGGADGSAGDQRNIGTSESGGTPRNAEIGQSEGTQRRTDIGGSTGTPESSGTGGNNGAAGSFGTETVVSGNYGTSGREGTSANTGMVRRTRTSGASASTVGAANNIRPVSGQRYTRGVGAVASHINDKYLFGKEGRKRLRKTIIGAAGGLAAGTIGLAAGVATGDLGKAVQYAGAGAAAGYIGASNLGENVWSGAKGIGNAYKKGAMGTEAYNNAQFDKQFFKSDEYKILEEKFGKDVAKKEAQAFLSQGFTDGAQMKKLMDKGIDAKTYGEYAAVHMKDADTIKKLSGAGINAESYGTFVDAGLRDVDKMEDLQKAGIGAEAYKAFADEGIRDIGKVLDLQKAGIGTEEYKKYKDEGIRDVDKVLDLQKAGIGTEDYKKYKDAGITDVNKIKDLKKKFPRKTSKQLRDMRTIAENFKDELSGAATTRSYTNFARKFNISEDEAKEIWDNIKDLL